MSGRPRVLPQAGPGRGERLHQEHPERDPRGGRGDSVNARLQGRGGGEVPVRLSEGHLQ